MRVVGCFLEYRQTFVILLRHSHKPEGNTWGLPSGKVETGETDVDAMLRELYEETGYRASAAELQHIGNYDFVNAGGSPYTYVTFRLQLTDPHILKLETTAHADYKWVNAQECYDKTDLISSFHELLKLTGHIR